QGLGIQASNSQAPAEHIVVSETVIHAEKSAIVIGPENQARINNIRVEAVDVARGTQGVSVTQKPGAGMSSLTFSNLTMQLIAPPDDISSGIAFQIMCFAGADEKTIRDVTFEGIDTNAY